MAEAAAPVQNLDAEESVLGAMMTTKAALSVTIDPGLVPEHFYRDRHRTIYETIVGLHHKGSPVDTLTVSAELDRHGLLDGVGGGDGVAALAAKVPAPGSARAYARIVKDAALVRRLDGAAKMIQQSIVERDGTPGELAAGAMRTVLEAIGDDQAEGPTEPEDLQSWFFDWLADPSTVDCFTLPWERLNAYCGGGLARGQETVITGPTSDGKSTILDQALERFSRDGYRCGIHGTEMSREERMSRYASKGTGVPFHRIFFKTMDPKQAQQVGTFIAEKPPPWRFRDAEGWSMDRIAMDVIAAGLDVVAIDPINLIEGANETKNMDRIAYELKALANRANCHVIAVAHLTKIPLGRSGKPRRPQLDDIRQSAMVGANATNVLLMYRDREADDNGNVKVRDSAWLGWLKARNGHRDEGVRVEPSAPGSYSYRLETKQKQEAMDTGNDGATTSAATGKAAINKPPEPAEVFG